MELIDDSGGPTKAACPRAAALTTFAIPHEGAGCRIPSRCRLLQPSDEVIRRRGFLPGEGAPDDDTAIWGHKIDPGKLYAKRLRVRWAWYVHAVESRRLLPIPHILACQDDLLPPERSDVLQVLLGHVLAVGAHGLDGLLQPQCIP